LPQAAQSDPRGLALSSDGSFLSVPLGLREVNRGSYQQ
jgi:hypothetical protein